jgi:hypothetical protein
MRRLQGWSEGECELVERDADTIMQVEAGADRVMAAAQVLHERVACRDGAQRCGSFHARIGCSRAFSRP